MINLKILIKCSFYKLQATRHNVPHTLIQCFNKIKLKSFQKLTKIHNFPDCYEKACTLVRAKRKRCYDVMLSRQEGSTTRHLVSALVLRTDLPVETQDVFF